MLETNNIYNWSMEYLIRLFQLYNYFQLPYIIGIYGGNFTECLLENSLCVNFNLSQKVFIVIHVVSEN